jgi:hypothetical protein
MTRHSPSGDATKSRYRLARCICGLCETRGTRVCSACKGTGYDGYKISDKELDEIISDLIESQKIIHEDYCGNVCCNQCKNNKESISILIEEENEKA